MHLEYKQQQQQTWRNYFLLLFPNNFWTLPKMTPTFLKTPLFLKGYDLKELLC